MAAKIKKGDTVEVIAGKDKGKRGRVLEVLVDEDRVVVEGVNIQKRHIRAGSRQSMPQGGILDKPGKIHISNVKFFSAKLDKAVRVGFDTKEDGTKVRVARGESNGSELD